jgi:iron complex outermembrane receptor protein
MGYESKLIFPLMENHYGLLDLTLFSDFTRGQIVNGGDVSRMPPFRFGFQIDHNQGDWNSNLRLTHGEAQDRPGAFDTATDAYVQLNLSTQYHIKQIKDVDVIVFAKGNNLLDDNIRNSTSYLRNFAPESGRGAEIGIRVNY